MAQNPIQQGGGSAYSVPSALNSPNSGLPATSLSTPGAPGVSAVDDESQKATYAATTASMVLHATPNDVIQIQGAANIVTRIKRIRFAVGTTVAGTLNLSLIRRSTGSTGGTSATFTATYLDSGLGQSVTASTLFNTWTVDPTVTGTTVANIVNMPLVTNTKALGSTLTTLTFGDFNTKAIVLRGATDFLAINLNGSTLTNADNAMTFDCEFTEESATT